MLSENNCITKLLGLKDVFITSVEEKEDCIYIGIETSPKPNYCPCCGEVSSYIHDYRKQKIKDLSFRRKFVYLLLKKRRYICMHCGKKFYERYSFLPKYHRMAQRVYENIIYCLRENYSMKSVSKMFNVSQTTIARVFDIVNYGLYKLPDTIALKAMQGMKNIRLLSQIPTRKKSLIYCLTEQKLA